MTDFYLFDFSSFFLYRIHFDNTNKKKNQSHTNEICGEKIGLQSISDVDAYH